MSRLILITLLLAACPVSHARESQLQAGAALSNITPPLGELVVGGWVPTPAKHIHDELHARCLVLDDGQTQVAIVLCDNVGIPREVFDLARQQIADATELQPSHILMASTHTHSATTARGPSKVIWQDELTEYQTFLARRISDGVRRAINQLEPARIGFGTVDEPSEVFNRRWHVTDSDMRRNPFGGVDTVRMNPPRGNAALIKPAGPIDPEVCFVSVQSLAGRPIALLANYSLHYVGGVPSGHVSADYFGYFAKYVAQGLNATDQEIPFVGILSNGTSGDINNINFREKSPRRQPYEKMQEVARKVADKVLAAHAGIKFEEAVLVGAKFDELSLKVRQPTEQMRKHLATARARSKDDPGAHRRELIYADRVDKLSNAPETISVPLQVVSIGDVAISAIPFETFVEIGLDLKDQTPFEHAFTIELANGSYGYLPTPEQHGLGGYETWLGTNFVDFNASAKITARLLQMQRQLLPAAKP